LRHFLVYISFFVLSIGGLSAQTESYFDLRGQSFSDPVKLDGKWEFYWQQFISEKNNQGSFELLEVPGDWYQEPFDKQFTKTGYGTYRTTVVVDGANPEDLGLYIPHIFSSYKLLINGDLVYKSGDVGKSRKEYQPNREPKVFNLSKYGQSEYEIIIEVANYDHMNSGLLYSLELGNFEDLRYELMARQDVNLFLAGGLFITGFVLLAFAISYKQLELQIPFYALFSISLMYRMLGADPYPLHALFTGYPFGISIHLEYLTIHSAALFGGLFVFYLYPNQTNKYLKYIFVIGTLFSMGCIVFLEPVVFTGLLKYYLFFVIVYVGVFIYIIAKARIEREVSSSFLVFAMVVVLLWTAFQIITFLGLGKVPYYLNVALMSMIVVFCNLALFRTFMLKIQSVDQAQAEFNLNKAKQNMLSLISHEIKTPVSTLRMNIEMLKAGLESGKAIPDSMMEKIVWGSSEAVVDIKQMVNDFVYFMSRADAGVCVIAAEEIASRLTARFTMNQLSIKVASGLKGSYKTDLLTLEYILSTLLNNAEKYSSSSDPTPELCLYEQEDHLIIEVKDYGVGMDKEQIRQLGETKLQLNEKSEISGVGFYLARELSNQLDHNLNIESNPGVGTSVRIELKRND